VGGRIKLHTGVLRTVFISLAILEETSGSISYGNGFEEPLRDRGRGLLARPGFVVGAGARHVP